MNDNKSSFLFGIRPIMEMIESGKDVEKLLLQQGLKGENYKQLFTLIKLNNIPFQYVPIYKLNKITRKNHQGVVAFISPISYQPIEEVITGLYEEAIEPFFVVLDQITDVRNVGAIARSAECAGVNALIVPEKGNAMLNADAVKSSAGALLNIPVCRVKNLQNALKNMKDNGIKIVGVTEKGDKNYHDIDYSGPMAIVLGSEDEGISKNVLGECEEITFIPMYGKTESLNVSVASGIILFEAASIRNR